MRRFLDEISPLLAGFQIAVSIVGFFGIGTVATWILEHWLPLTRLAWTRILELVNVPDISSPEKDALTTLAFFAPMAISSFISWYTRKNPNRTEPWTETLESDVAKEVRLRIMAAVVGTIFMIAVGGSVVQDAVTLFTTDSPTTVDVSVRKPVFNIETFAQIGLLVSVLTFLLAVSVSIYVLSIRSKRLSYRVKYAIVFLTKYAKPVRKNVYSAAFGVATSIISSLLSLVSFATMFGGIIFASGQLGLIRTTAPLLVLTSLLATIFLDPTRLLKTGGVVIAFVLASLGGDLAVMLVRAVENAAP
jgi:hypothetical protein